MLARSLENTTTLNRNGHKRNAAARTAKLSRIGRRVRNIRKITKAFPHKSRKETTSKNRIIAYPPNIL